MTLSDASVAEVRRRGKRRKSSLHPPIRGRATRIYLRKEGTGVEHTETRGLKATGRNTSYAVVPHGTVKNVISSRTAHTPHFASLSSLRGDSNPIGYAR